MVLTIDGWVANNPAGPESMRRYSIVLPTEQAPPLCALLQREVDAIESGEYDDE